MISDIESVNIKRLNLYQQLFIYGDFIPLKFKVDLNQFSKEISQFNSSWVTYNKHKGDTGRMGLSVTSLDGGLSGEPDLQSLYEYSQRTGIKVSENQFCVPTDVYKKVESMHALLNHFEGGLGRCRIVKFAPGGFFPPHRDQSVSFQVPDYFRIFVPLTNTGEHSVFSFQNEVYTLAISLQLNSLNIKCAVDALEVK